VEAEALREAVLMTEAEEVRQRCIRQFAITAEKTAKFLSGQPAANLCFAVIVFKITELLIQEGLMVEIPADQPVQMREECLRLPVMNAETAARFLSSQAAESQFTAVTVLERKKAPEIKTGISSESCIINWIKYYCY
jgi:hypothetical protein